MADPTFEVGICHAFFMISWKTLSDSDLLTDLERGVTSYAVETTELTYCRIVVDRNAAKRRPLQEYIHHEPDELELWIGMNVLMQLCTPVLHHHSDIQGNLNLK